RRLRSMTGWSKRRSSWIVVSAGGSLRPRPRGERSIRSTPRAKRPAHGCQRRVRSRMTPETKTVFPIPRARRCWKMRINNMGGGLVVGGNEDDRKMAEKKEVHEGGEPAAFDIRTYHDVERADRVDAFAVNSQFDRFEPAAAEDFAAVREHPVRAMRCLGGAR